MSQIETPSSATTDGTAVDRAEPVLALASENDALVLQLRAAKIPQHVGMAAACRVLAADLPRDLAHQVDADLASGALAERWDAVRASAAETSEGRDLSIPAVLAVLLREQTRAVMRHLAMKAKEWTADAYRLEGQAAALEDQATRLRQIAGASGSPTGADPEDATEDPGDAGTAG